MKTRSSFVTNSSSSSFVIAFKDNTSEDDIKNILNSQQEIIKNTLSWCDNFDLEEVIEDAADTLIRIKNSGIKLDNWVVGAAEFSSDGDMYECALYELGEINTEKIKIKEGYC
jgi:hypothetical protein